MDVFIPATVDTADDVEVVGIEATIDESIDVAAGDADQAADDFTGVIGDLVGEVTVSDDLTVAWEPSCQMSHPGPYRTMHWVSRSMLWRSRVSMLGP